VPKVQPICGGDGCERPVHARGLCASDYHKWRKEQLKESGAKCDCGKPVYNIKRQLCMACYERYRLYGDPSVTNRPDLGKTVEARFWEKVDKSGPRGCWVWTASVNPRTGYGQFIVMGAKRGYPRMAHRVAWELMRRPLAPGEVIDHLCRNRACVNPDHLQPVTNRVNILRGIAPSAINARKDECNSGHKFTPENTYVPPGRPTVRQCRKCARRREQERRQRRPAA